MQNLNWFSVNSSNVDKVAHDAAQWQLFVGFKNGSVYRYDNVPLATYQDMLAAPSKGQFVWQRLRNQFPTLRVV